MRDNKKTLGPLSRSALFAGLCSEIRYQLRYNPKIKGSDVWKNRKRESKPYVHKPKFSIMVENKWETGRSEKYHAERVEEMALRNELGADLWADDLQPADLETFEGTELTEKEQEFITKILDSKPIIDTSCV